MKVLLSLTFAVFIGLGSVAYAQQSPPSQDQRQPDAQAVTLTGCLTKGASANQYVIADSNSGEKFPFAGPEKVDGYVNRTVQLTGKMMDRDGKKAFQPETIKVVSASCEGSQKQ